MMIGGLSCISCMFVPLGKLKLVSTNINFNNLSGRGRPLVDCRPSHGGKVQHRPLLRRHLRLRWGADAHRSAISGGIINIQIMLSRLA